jgi:D-alanyl-D-alanine carboxypeptidase (penicillin-binding protein 5/6)
MEASKPYRKPKRQSSLFFIFFYFLFALSLFAEEPVPLNPADDAPELASRAAVLMDAATGTILYAKNGDEPISPASLTKLMTIHIALEEVAAGRASLDEQVPLPRESWAINQPPRSSLMFLAPGQIVSLRELLLGLAIPSGNDAAVAVALRFSPSVPEFAELMTREARRLGLAETWFEEPSGISENNMTTAMEFTRFCKEYLTRHPETLRDYHSVPEFAYPKTTNVAAAYQDHPGTIIQQNRNALLKTFEGVDGLKTGYIDEAGYNIALTAARLKTRLIAVVLGAPASPGGDHIRDADSRALLTWGFNHFKTLTPPPPELPPVRVWKAKANQIAVLPSEDLTYTILTHRGRDLRWETALIDPLTAPLEAGAPAGDLILLDDLGELRRMPLLTAESAPQGSIFKRVWHSIRLFFRRLFSKKGEDSRIV